MNMLSYTRNARPWTYGLVFALLAQPTALWAQNGDPDAMNQAALDAQNAEAMMPATIVEQAPIPVAPQDRLPIQPPDPAQVNLAVTGGLRWLARTQIRQGPDAGSWPHPSYSTAVASLAGLAFLANGHTPGEGEYGAVVDRAMAYVKASMTGDGYLGHRGSSMYVHAICTLFGLSYLGMSDDPEQEREMAEWCGKAIALIIAAQQVQKPPAEQGGWRYLPFGNESDVSVTSWQLMVLHAAQQSGYDIDPAVIDRAMRYVNSAYLEDEQGRGGFVYRPGISLSVEAGVTGSSIFLKSIFEPGRDDKLAKSLAYLQQYEPSWGGPLYRGYFFFGSFYITQGMYQLGGASRDEYVPAIQRVLIDHQNGDGSWPFPVDNRVGDHAVGPAYATAMGVLILSFEKQYLPMYQRQRALFR